MRLGRGFVWFVAAAMAVVACSNSDGSTAPTSAPTSTAPSPSTTEVPYVNGASTTEQILDDMRREGASELELALVELTAYVGPVPGVRTVELDDSLHRSITTPLNRVMYQREDLTEAQRTVLDDSFDEMFDPDQFALVLESDESDGSGDEPSTSVQGFASPASPESTTTTISPDCPRRTPGADVAVTPELQRWRDAFDDVAPRFRRTFSGVLDYVVLIADPRLGDIEDSSAGTLVGGREFAGGRLLTGFQACFGDHDCYIMIRETDATGPDAISMMTHEMFHCWHYVTAGSDEAYHNAPMWVTEGLASWVGDKFAGGSGFGNKFWTRYFVGDRSVRSDPGADSGLYDLFFATYSAIGFFSYVDQHTTLETLIPDLIREAASGDPSLVYAAAMQRLNPEERAAVGAAATQRRDLGPRWTTSGPGMPRGRRADPREDVRPGAGIELIAEPGVQLANDIEFDIDGTENWVASTRLENFGRLTWTDGLSVWAGSERVDEKRCFGVCECPDGTVVPTSMPSIEADEAAFTVALSGGPWSNARLQVIVEPLDDFCDEPEPEPEPEPELGSPPPREPGRGGSYGHPNLITFDGVGYVFHGAGDYALVESTSGDLEIQTRFSRLNNMTGVSFNRAIAARVGDSVVTFGDAAESTAFDPVIVRVDGEVVDPDDLPVDVADGEANLTRFGGRTVLSWVDGTELRVGELVGEQFDVRVPEEQWGQVVGLLGNANSDPYDDLVTRNGVEADPYDFEPFYADFGASWLVDPADSLFDSTLDPVDIEPIVPTAQVALADLPAEQRDAAEQICRDGGVEPGAGLAQCMFDVAMTGDLSWVRSVLAMREIIDDSFSVTALLDDIEDAVEMPDDASVSGELGERFAADVFDVELAVGSTLDVTTTDCPDDTTFEMALISPADFILDRSRGADCGSLRVRGVSQPGVYRVAVYDVGGFTGAYGFEYSIVEVSDGDRVEYGEAFELTVDEDLESSVITFDARAGDRLLFEHPETDGGQPNIGFAQYRLLAPDGSVLQSWPAREDREIQIAVDGTYTLFIEVIVGVSAGSVPMVITATGRSVPVAVEIGQPFAMEVAEPGDNPLATFEATGGDTLLFTAEVPEPYFEAAATFTLLGPDGAELAWWFSFRDGEVEIPLDGMYTLVFEPGVSDRVDTLEVTINRQ